MRLGFLFLIVVFCLAFSQVADTTSVKGKAISTGENLNYRMYLGIFTVGKGVTTVDKNVYVKNNRGCFKVDAFMETLGIATWISKVNDNWGAFVDTSELVTHESYRKLREGPYQLHEVVTYGHEKDEASVVVADKVTGK